MTIEKQDAIEHAKRQLICYAWVDSDAYEEPECESLNTILSELYDAGEKADTDE